MKLKISKDIFNNPVPPQVFLCETDKTIIGQLHPFDTSLDARWNTYSELNFSIDRKYTDVLMGGSVVDPLFDLAEGLRKVYIKDIGYFIIQDPDSNYGEKDTKQISCFSSEYETAQKYLENFYINTGEINSREVEYQAQREGVSYTFNPDSIYRRTTTWNENVSYYVIKKQNTSGGQFYDAYVQKGFTNEADFRAYLADGNQVYVKNFENVRFYNRGTPELSLLHIIFEKIPEWKIGEVDVSLWRKERKFSEERVAVYDFLMNDLADKFNCVIEWDTIKNEVNFYEEAEDGIEKNGEVQTRFDTDVYISRENLANEINIKYSVDDIKTKLKVMGSDTLNIRDVNIGNDSIMDLSYYHTKEWMGEDLYNAYQAYINITEKCKPIYDNLVAQWVVSWNEWNRLTNGIAETDDVVSEGDIFERLLCTYAPAISDDYTDSEKTAAIEASIIALKEKLIIYEAGIIANNVDDILLTLRDSDSNIAEIRIVYDGGEYYVECDITQWIDPIDGHTSSGFTYNPKPDRCTLSDWLSGNITAKKLGLVDDAGKPTFIVSQIGTLGAYFCLTEVDAAKEDNIKDFGVNQLKEMKLVYATLFQVQTESMYSQEGYQCVVSAAEPEEPPDGTIWLDFDEQDVNKAVKKYVVNKGIGSWKVVSDTIGRSNMYLYQKYKDNLDKFKTVQKVLAEKEKEATLLQEGYPVTGLVGSSLQTLSKAVYTYFNQKGIQFSTTNILAGIDVPQNIKLDVLFFTFGNKKYAAYFKEGVPYIAYADSYVITQLQRDYIHRVTDIENIIPDDLWPRLSPFIREDEYTNDSFLLTGYESEAQRIQICKELMEDASTELKRISKPVWEFDMEMSNILALPEFAPIKDQFELGNFVRVEITEGYVRRARLLEVHLSFDDLSDFNSKFGNLVATRSELDKHAELLQQALEAGKQVATSAHDWQATVDKSNKLEMAIAEGLKDAALAIGKTYGQNITWDEHGIHGRKLKDGTTDEYDPQQFIISNNKFVFTDNDWETAKAVFGKYIVNNTTYWGVLAEAVIAGFIQGCAIEGGTIKIGEQSNGNYAFEVKEDGTVTMGGGSSLGNTTVDTLLGNVGSVMGDVDSIKNQIRYTTHLEYSNSTIFTQPKQNCTVTCKILEWGEDVTEQIMKEKTDVTFSWKRISDNSTEDKTWNQNHSKLNANTITIKTEDVNKNAQFSCEVEWKE